MTRGRRLSLLVGTLVASLVLGACGPTASAPDPKPDSKPDPKPAPKPEPTLYKLWGMVVLSDYVPQPGVYGFGTFVRLAEPTATPEALSPFRVNTCSYAPDPLGDRSDPGLPVGVTQDVGAALQVKQLNTVGSLVPFLSLGRAMLDSQQVGYFSDPAQTERLAMPPSGLTLDIPGSPALPAQKDLAFPTPPPPPPNSAYGFYPLEQPSPIFWSTGPTTPDPDGVSGNREQPV